MRVAFLVIMLVCPVQAGAQRGIESPEALEKRIAALWPEKLVWREIEWQRCLLAGLEESARRKKPVLLWVFLHHPNDERC